MIETFHNVFRGFHIAVGGVGLILFWIPIVTRKGSPVHRAAGRWFVRSVYVVAGSGLISSVWAIASPATFVNSANVPAAVADTLRFFFSILALLSVFALQGAVLGTRVLRVKDRSEPLRSPPLSLVLAVQLLGSITLAAFAAYSLWTTAFESRYYVPLAIAALGLIDYFEQRKYIAAPQPRRAWFFKHLECMIGCGIAFYTAASVTFFGRVLQLNLPGPLAMVPWLLPAAIGVPAIALTKRHYRRQFADPGAAVVQVGSENAAVNRASHAGPEH
jgi:hypothetical protein